MVFEGIDDASFGLGLFPNFFSQFDFKVGSSDIGVVSIDSPDLHSRDVVNQIGTHANRNGSVKENPENTPAALFIIDNAARSIRTIPHVPARLDRPVVVFVIQSDGLTAI